MNLIHDIISSLKEKKNITYVFLNIKKVYDYVSIKQLLNVMNKLYLSTQTLKWVKEFMNDRLIELTFNEKSKKRDKFESKYLLRFLKLLQCEYRFIRIDQQIDRWFCNHRFYSFI
jgi:hypothetical protein